MISLEQLQKLHKSICKDAFDLVGSKGHDYNLRQQESGDTLFNLRVPSILKIDETPMDTCLGYISGKLQRLISLKNPENLPKHESIRDAVRDIVNYSIYFEAFYEEELDRLKKKK